MEKWKLLLTASIHLLDMCVNELSDESSPNPDDLQLRPQTWVTGLKHVNSPRLPSWAGVELTL